MTINSGAYATVSGMNTGRTIINGDVSEHIPSAWSYSPGYWLRNSQNTPGYHKGHRSENKHLSPIDLPMNGFLFQKDRVDHPVADEVYVRLDSSNKTSYIKVESGLHDSGVVSPGRSSSDSATLDAKAASKMLSGLKDQVVNLGVAVAEGRKSLDMIAKTAKRLAEAGFAVKKANFAGAAAALGVPFTRSARKRTRTSNSVASNWLELQYGWLPLLSDIHGAAEFVAKTMNYHPRSRYSSSASKTESFKETNVARLRTVTDSWSTEHTVRYVIYFSEQGGGNPPTALGLTNPLAVAWELVPFSFIVDWFLPVGTFLNNLDATNGLSFVKGCKTEFWRARSTRHVGSYSESSGSITESVYANYESRKELIYCERKRLNGFPQSPVPEFRNPLSGRKGDYTHEINTIALMSQAFR